MAPEMLFVFGMLHSSSTQGSLSISRERSPCCGVPPLLPASATDGAPLAVTATLAPIARRAAGLGLHRADFLLLIALALILVVRARIVLCQEAVLRQNRHALSTMHPGGRPHRQQRGWRKGMPA